MSELIVFYVLGGVDEFISVVTSQYLQTQTGSSFGDQVPSA